VDGGLHPVSDAADGDDAGACDGEEAVQQQTGEREVAEVVRTELQLEAVRGDLLRRVHHARVVDQQVDTFMFVPQVRRCGTDRVKRGQVEWPHPDVTSHPGGRPLTFLDIANREDHRRTVVGKHPGGFETQPSVGTGNDRHPPDLIGDLLLGPVVGHDAPLKTDGLLLLAS